jgi:hypothetical protein
VASTTVDDGELYQFIKAPGAVALIFTEPELPQIYPLPAKIVGPFAVIETEPELLQPLEVLAVTE